jgi:outer membrane beta-barrel protein
MPLLGAGAALAALPAYSAPAQNGPVLIAAADPATDAAGGPKPANEQVVTPELDRRDVQVVHIPSNDFEAGVFTGAYNTENFGASLVGGVRLGYHITEDVFVEAVYGQTKVSDATFRDILPGGIFPAPKEILRYYDLSAGYNVFPGEIFLGRKHAKVSALYVVAGLGTTKFNNTSHQTVNFGLGMRVFLTNWVAVQADVRDHMYSVDLLGTKRDTTNLETTLGATFFF